MLKVHSKNHPSNDPEHQKKMLPIEESKVSIEFKDGGYHVYTPVLMNQALEFIDALSYKSSDVLSPGPTLIMNIRRKPYK